MARIDGHGGDLALAALRGFGVTELFTLSGGHVFPLYDAAKKAGVRVIVLGGRAPQFRWGSGSLQEMDHLPIVRSATKHAETIFTTGEIYARMQAAALTALTPHRGPVFVDLPLEVAFSTADGAE